MTAHTHEGVIIVLDSYGTEAEATAAMHRQARVLRRRRLTGRYGVFVEQRRGAWWLCLNDRKA